MGDNGLVWTRKVRGSGTKMGTWRELIPTPSRNPNYLRVGLSKDNKQTSFLVSNLVLMAFEGPCPEGMECCHNNGDSRDNRLSNLRWGTPKENGEDRVTHGTTARGSRNHKAKLTEQDVVEIRRLRSKGVRQITLCRHFNVSDGTMSLICRNKIWKHV